nr:hypothetical protein [Tanacetum cinerariifolium]
MLFLHYERVTVSSVDKIGVIAMHGGSSKIIISLNGIELSSSSSSRSKWESSDIAKSALIFLVLIGDQEQQHWYELSSHEAQSLNHSSFVEVIKSSVEDLVPIPSESAGIPDNMCNVPFRDNSPPLDILKDQFEDFSESNDDSTLIDDDYFSIDDIDYVEASPPDYELVS